MWPLSAKIIYENVLNLKCDKNNYEYLSIEGFFQDSRNIIPNCMFVAIRGEQFDGHKYLNQCFEQNVPLALVEKNSNYYFDLSEENKNKCICVEDTIQALRNLAHYFRKSFQFPIVGIGGSNGKTTTKEFLFSYLKFSNNFVTKTNKSENGYLGLALTILQNSHRNENPPKTLVAEIGIDETGAMQKHVELCQPNFVLLTALGPEHIEGLQSWENAIKEEFKLFNTPNAIRIWQLNDPKIREKYFENLTLQTLNIINDAVVVEKVDYEKNKMNIQNFCNRQIIWEIKLENELNSQVFIQYFNKQYNLNLTFSLSCPLPGKHNAANCVLALATGLTMGIDYKNLLEGLKQFVPPPMRSQIQALKNGPILYNDTYNSSPFSVEAALKVLQKSAYEKKSKLVLLGDMLELGTESNYWHEYIVTSILKANLNYLCLYGSAMYSCYKLILEKKCEYSNWNDTKIYWLNSNESSIKFLDNLHENLSNYIILVKGSRALKLEQFINAVEEKYKE